MLRYFPTQALNFAFKDAIKAAFAVPKDASSGYKFGMNIASGGMAGTMSLLFVYSLDYARTRYRNVVLKNQILLYCPNVGWPMTLRARVVRGSSTASLTSTPRLSSLTAFRACTEALPSPPLVSSSTVACTSVCLTH